MISGQFYTLFNDPSANKQCVISTSDDGESIVITHDDLIADSMSLDSVLSSADDIVFGTCCGTQVEFKLNNTKLSSLNDRVISIDYYFDGIDDPFKMGVFKVINDSIESDRRSRKVVAVDSTELIKKADVAPWYNAIDFTSPITLRQLRTSLEAYMNLQYGIIFRWDTTEESPILCNDSLLVQKTIDSEHIEFADVISSICELNGTFFVHDNEGKYYYKTLGRQSQATLNSTVIPPVTFANYTVPGINRVVIRENDDDDGVSYPDLEDIDDNVIVNNYIVVGNFLTYGRTDSTAEGSVRYAAQMLYNQIHDLSYVPVEADAVGNPCIEIGDCITIHAANGVDDDGYPVYEDIKTYIMERSLTGLKILKDKYTSSGSEVREAVIESSGSQIKQLKSVTSKLRYEQNGLVSQMQIMNDNMGTISTNVSTLTQTVNGFSARIEQAEQSASSASSSVSELSQTVSGFNTRISTIENDYVTESEISQMAGQIEAKVSTTDGDSTTAASWSLTPENGMVITAHQANTDAFAVVVGDDKVISVNSNGMALKGTLTIDDGEGVTNSVTDDGVATERVRYIDGTDDAFKIVEKTELKEGQISSSAETVVGWWDASVTPPEFIPVQSGVGGISMGYREPDQTQTLPLAKPYIELRQNTTGNGPSVMIEPNNIYMGGYGGLGDLILSADPDPAVAARLGSGEQFKVTSNLGIGHLVVDGSMLCKNHVVVDGTIYEDGVALVNKYAPLQSALSGRGRWYTMDNPVTGYARINLNLAAHTMFNLTLKIYSGYRAYDLQISGYYYVGYSNPFYMPKAILLASSREDGISVYLGYNSDGTLYIAVPADGYFAVQITEALTGFVPTGNVDIISSVVIEQTLSGSVAFASTLYPPRIWTDCGTGTINADTFTRVYFNRAFPSVPKVVATYVQSSWPSGQIGSIKINNVDTTGFDATVSGSWSGNVGINWIAMI